MKKYAYAFLCLGLLLMSEGIAAGQNGAAKPNARVEMTAQFSAMVPVYRTDGAAGDDFSGFNRVIGPLPVQSYCFDSRTLLAPGGPQLCTSSTPSFFRLNVSASPQIGFQYDAKCEAANLDLGFIAPELDLSHLTFPGALRLYADVAIGGTIPVNILGNIVNIPIPLIPILNDQAIGYIARGKNQTDVQSAVAAIDALLSDPALVQTMLASGGLLAGLFDENGNLAIDLSTLTLEEAQAILAQIQQLWPFLQVVSPVFLPPVHAYHEACRTEQEMQLGIRFRKTATLVNAGSGNQQLNFKAWAPFGNFFGLFDANIHFKANDNKSPGGMTRAQGILLSTNAMFFIDLSQLDGQPGNLLTPLLEGSGIPIKACMTFLPKHCVAANLTASVH